jgi:hypothetical protein
MLKPVVMLLTLFVLTVGSALAAPAKCPVINGTYAMDVEIDGDLFTYRVTLYTRIKNGVYAYALSKSGVYIPADGKPYPLAFGGTEVKVTFRCEGGSLTSENRKDGIDGAYVYRFTSESSTQLKVESNVPGRSGLHILED